MAEPQSQDEEPTAHKTHQLDQYALKGVSKAEKLQGKFGKHQDNDEKASDAKSNEKKPAGGFDSTPTPNAKPGFTVKFTFHSASELPIADLNTLSSDPYIEAELKTDLKKRHRQDPSLRHRTRTIRRDLNPHWNEEWIVANVPASGFRLKCRLYDEDPADHDDRLGNVHVDVDGITEEWQGICEQSYRIKPRSGSKRAYLLRGCTAMFRKDVHLSGHVIISAEVLGQTDTSNGGRMWTVGPCQWIKHFSPMIGRLTGIKDKEETNKEGHEVNKYNFQANQMQLRGPVPEELYHRYVEFKPFVKGMFNGLGLRGRILNRALHHQHARIYNFDRSTEYGSFAEPCLDMTKEFLDLVHYAEGGRIFTYVLSLDGLWRFTETGKEFGIDLLSKHTMHSDVSIYIAFSGEFFVRRICKHNEAPVEANASSSEGIECDHDPEEMSEDPSHYQLIIDNDSGTYRPKKELLPQLKEFLSRSLPGLKITTLDCSDDAQKLSDLKEEQRKRKKERGEVTFTQVSGSDDSSISDQSELDAESTSHR